MSIAESFAVPLRASALPLDLLLAEPQSSLTHTHSDCDNRSIVGTMAERVGL